MRYTRIGLLILLMTLIAGAVGGTALWRMYRTALAGEQSRLEMTVKSHARLFEAIYRLEEKHFARNGEEPEAAFLHVLEALKESAGRYEGHGETGEFTLAKREGGKIRFLMTHRHGGLAQPEPVPWGSTLAEPMRRALGGNSGIVIGPDYRGETVVAAFEPMRVHLPLGLVAKIDLAEVRAPFLRTARTVGGMAILLIIGGSFLFFRLTAPLVRRLEESETRNRLILESAGEGILGLDAQGRHTFVNPAAAKMLGWGPEELIGKESHPLWHHTRPDGSPYQEGECPVTGVLENGTAHTAGEDLFWRKDGSSFPATYTSTPIRQNGTRGAVVVFRDVTREKADRELLEKLNRTLRLLSLGNQILVRSGSEEELLDAICTLFTDTGLYPAAWILIAGEGEPDRPRSAAVSGADPATLAAILERGETEREPLPLVEALRSLTPRIIRDLSSRELPASCREAAGKLRAGSLAAFPFAVNHTRRGAIVLFAGETDAFGEKEINLLEELAGDLAYGLIAFQTREARQKSEEEVRLFRALTDHSNDAIYLVAPETGRLLDLNARACEQLGYGREELLAMRIADLSADFPDPEAWRRHLAEIRERRSMLLEGTQTRKDGARFPVEVSVRLVHEGAKEYMVSIVRDITERKQMEEALAKSEEKYRTLVENIPLRIFMKDRDSVYLSCNRAFAEGAGVEEEAVRGKTDSDFFPEKLAKKQRDDDRRVMEEKRTEILTEEYALHGESKWIQTMKAPLLDGRGEVSGIIGAFWDVTEQVRIQEHLDEAQQIAGLGNWEYDMESDRVTCSSQVYRIYGIRDPARFRETYRGFRLLYHPDDRERIEEAFRKSLAHPAPVSVRHRLFREDDGRQVWVEQHWKAVFHEGKAVKTIGTIQDITERVRLEEELRKKEETILFQSRQAAMGEMIGMIAHQWRQPLATIGMAANNMILDIEMDALDKAEFTGNLEAVTTQVKHLSKTIDDFRNFFKPEKEKEPATIPSVMEDTLTIIGKSLENNNIAVEKRYASDTALPTFPRELIQLFLNLLANAKDALLERKRESARVRIEIAESAAEVTATLCDNAGGIPEELLERIFEPYFTTKEEQGTGLGLYMARSIARQHLGGDLTVENSDEGACFTLRLPKAQAD